MSLKVSGSQALKDVLRRFPKGAKAAAAVAQLNAAHRILPIAQERAPYEHGTLEDSAYISNPNYSNHAVTVEYGFGGAAVPYMVRQHEDLSYQHPGEHTRTDDPGRAAQGQAKFLESAVNENQDVIEDEYRRAIAHFARTGSMPPVREGPITKKAPS